MNRACKVGERMLKQGHYQRAGGEVLGNRREIGYETWLSWNGEIRLVSHTEIKIRGEPTIEGGGDA